MHAEYGHTGIEAVEVLGSEEADLIEFGGWQEERPRNSRVQDYCVCVEPSVPYKYSLVKPYPEDLEGLLDVHNPFCSLAVRFGHLLDDQTEDVSGLIEESGLDNIMSKYMCGHSPLFPMLDMCTYASFVDGAEFVSFVDHGCLSQPWTPPI